MVPDFVFQSLAQLKQAFFSIFGEIGPNGLSEPQAILAAALLAIGSAIVSYFLSLRRDMIFKRLTESERFISNSNPDVLRVLRIIGESSVDQASIDPGGSTVRLYWPEIHGLMTRFENTSASIRFGVVSETFILFNERGILLAVFHSLAPIIKVLRLPQNNPNILRNYEALVHRILLGPVILARLPELIWGRPLFPLTEVIFGFYYHWARWTYSGTGPSLDADPLVSNYFVLEGRIRALQWAGRVLIGIAVLGFFAGRGLAEAG